MLNPADTWRMTLCVKSTCSTTHHTHVPPWLRGVKRIEYPGCAPCQLFSKRLYSILTRRAFFNSNRFFTSQRVAVAGGAPLLPAAPVSVNVGSVTVQDCVTPAGLR